MAENETRSGDGEREERISAREAAGEAVTYIDEMTGQAPEVVTGVEAADEDGWLVTVEVLEMSRIPDTTDVLGCYQVQVDARGEPTSYRRIRRYHRGQIGED